MNRIAIGSTRYKGEYGFDIEREPLTTLEWRWVKKLSGYLPGTIQDGFEGGDPDLILAFSIIALYRAGKIQKTEALAVAELLEGEPVDGETIAVVDDEEDADPLAETAGPASENGSPNERSGASSNGTSENQENAPSPTGSPHSATSAMSESTTSVTSPPASSSTVST